MTSKQDRYIFVNYDSLTKVKFKKLEKVSSRIFIFVSNDNESIPLKLVKQIQKKGKSVKWITIDSNDESSLNYQIAFYLGQLHGRTKLETEFAILSNDEAFDTTVHFLNDSGRSCMRVKHKIEEQTPIEINTEPKIETISSPGFTPSFDKEELMEKNGNGGLSTMVYLNDDVVIKTAQETVDKLQQSGNRPSEISTLRSYILLHNRKKKIDNYIDDVILQMQELNEIEVNEGEVTYNF